MVRPAAPAHGDQNWDAYVESVFDDLYGTVVDSALVLTQGARLFVPKSDVMTGIPVVTQVTWDAALGDTGPFYSVVPLDPTSVVLTPGITLYSDKFTSDHDSMFRTSIPTTFPVVTLSGPPTTTALVHCCLQPNTVFQPLDDCVLESMGDGSTAVLDSGMTTSYPVGTSVGMGLGEYRFFMVVVVDSSADSALTWSITTPLEIATYEILRTL